MLAALRLGSHSLRGRRFPEPNHPYRTDFARDRDRIIHSRAFRRLEGKTQVFAAGLCDHFRNRLTHTIEVSQIARTVAAALDLNEEYTETLALAHDLGHPPFGHVGERELDRQMQKYGASFEHNRHALRIVDSLEQRYARFPGLNLTFEVREGIIKHSREVGAGEEPELDELFPGQRPPLEAQLLDLADEIAYNTADLDDAFAMGLFSMETIGDAVPAFRDLTEQVDTQFPGASQRARFWEVHRQIINILIGGLIHGTVAEAKAASVETIEDIRALDHRIAKLTDEAANINTQLNRLLAGTVYTYAELVEDRKAALKKMGELFGFLVEHPERVSPGYRENLLEQPVHRVVCDYIGGMTDAYLILKHRILVEGRDGNQ